MPNAEGVGRAELSCSSALLSPAAGRRRAATVPSVTAAQMAEADRRMVRDVGVGLLQMMELAGRSVAEQARVMLGGTAEGHTIVVLCGTGNNGGGGMVSARHLHAWGAKVQAVLVGTEAGLKPVPKRQWTILNRLGLAARTRTDPAAVAPDLIIDAIFGYGFHGRPPPAAARRIVWANAQGCPILALDIPSGLDPTTGFPSTPCVRATVTLSLALPKTGVHASQAADYVGEVNLADIGVVPEVYRAMGLVVGNLFEARSVVGLAGLLE